MAQYKHNTDNTVVEAVAWNGDLSEMDAFLSQFPPALNPKVTEDNPNANGIVSNDGVTLIIYPLDGIPVNAALTDMLIRSDGDHGLSTMTAANFNAAFTAVV